MVQGGQTSVMRDTVGGEGTKKYNTEILIGFESISNSHVFKYIYYILEIESDIIV